MNSPRLKKHSEFDVTIGHELKSWAGRQQAPSDVRARVLKQARAHSGNRRRMYAIRTQLDRWFAPKTHQRKPAIPYTELSQWLFNQAMWHSLGNDHRAVRFVC